MIHNSSSFTPEKVISNLPFGPRPMRRWKIRRLRRVFILLFRSELPELAPSGVYIPRDVESVHLWFLFLYIFMLLAHPPRVCTTSLTYMDESAVTHQSCNFSTLIVNTKPSVLLTSRR